MAEVHPNPTTRRVKYVGHTRPWAGDEGETRNHKSPPFDGAAHQSTVHDGLHG